MAKEENNSTTSQTNHDFVPNQSVIDNLAVLKTFCETEVDICNRALSRVQKTVIARNPKDPSANKALGTLERQQIASQALEFINQAIAHEKEYYSAKRRNKTNDVLNKIQNSPVNFYRQTYEFYDNATMGYLQNQYKGKNTSIDDLLTYAGNSFLNKHHRIFLKNAEKLAKARYDYERYQPLKDIMDAMIIMLAKASSVFMPPAVIDITIKALGSIGGHLADIIKEDFEKIRKQPNNSAELTELTKKQEELGKSTENMRSTVIELTQSLQGEELQNINKQGEQNIETTKKWTERKSIKDMRSELKNKRDTTFKDKVLKQQQEYQNKFKTR